MAEDTQSKAGRVQAHFAEYIGRYVVLASIVLVPLAGIVGDLAAEVGPDTKLGHTLLSVASALGTAAAIVVWLRNRGVFETAPLVGQAQGEAIAAALPAPVVGEFGIAGLSGPSGLVDSEVEAVPADDLPSDGEELAAPPPPPPDETNTPVQPSQVGLTDADHDDPPRP